jgi:enamine deaminase RidA (YjgF/YER057c/UK114 family)
MNPTTIDVPGLPPANTTYSQVSILGDLVFVSGQIGIDPATGRLADGGIPMTSLKSTFSKKCSDSF